MGITARVLAALAGTRGRTVAQLAAALGRHTSTLYMTLERARLDGCVRRKAAAPVGRKPSYVYTLAPHGARRLAWYKKQGGGR